MTPRSIIWLLLVVLYSVFDASEAWMSTSPPTVASPSNRMEKVVTNLWRAPRLSSQPSLTLRATVEFETKIPSVVAADNDEEDDNLHRLRLASAEGSNNESQLELKDKIINGIFLSASFGYALYTIFSIDQGLTRGWTGSEIAMRIPLDNWGAYESYLANKPVVTKTLINVIIYLLGDWLSQTAFQGKNVLEFDIKRTLRNGFIGLCFGPLVHEYYQFSDAILPPDDGIIVRLQKIVMDQTIYLTIKCSIYISAVGLLSGDDWSTVQQTVKDKIVGIVFTAWKFWPLVHCITYGLIPARHRILWVNSVDLVWNAILATKAQKGSPNDDVVDVLVVSENADETDMVKQLDTVHDQPNPHHGTNETFFYNQESFIVEINTSTSDSTSAATNATASVAYVG